ncbi:hypothetical protein LCGC14_0480260 [marine sediment metagenome]|uniref:O-antigen ligase domain-containing protein n=1 Tax=marine sediment metagenome TaxID=412755 RepID=A0A0F9VI87_9ZZZZ|nr:hypothetical protein [Methylophaga sp.]
MGNGFAYAVMLFWPFMAIYLYQTRTIQVATIWVILGGFMFLPVGTDVDLPFIPAFGKNSIPVISAMIGCWFVVKKPVHYFKNKGLTKLLVLMLIIGPFITVMNNQEAVIVSDRFLPGLSMHDAFSTVVNQMLLITPFFMGWQFFRTYQNHLLIFKIIVVAGLFYSILILFEIRMSPQLHTWVYGYFPHSFAQQARGGGFRAVVFMGHGLLVAFFSAVVFISATALWTNNKKIRQFSPVVVSYYLLMVLILCKSLASLLYGIFGLIIIKLAKPRTQIRVALILAALALFYPTMSIMKVFPHHELIEVARTISPERASSLDYRFKNESILLARGREKFFFGWGGWGRNRVYNEATGKDESVTDGRWIITFGQFGFFGFIAEFGLLAITIIRASQAAKIVKSKEELVLLSAHALLVGLIMIDQLPNASLAPWLWLLAGILLGRAEDIISKNITLSIT